MQRCRFYIAAANKLFATTAEKMMTDQNRTQQNQRVGKNKGGQGGNSRAQSHQGQGGKDRDMQSQGRQDEDIETEDADDFQMEGRGGRPGGARNRRVDNRGSDNPSDNR
jgi:hypothetical protein